MKKLVAFFAICVLLLTSVASVTAEGIYVHSESGDRIRILEDAIINEPIQGNVVLVLGDVTVNSKVSGHIITVFGDVSVNSFVSGQVVTLFGNTVLHDNAQVMSDVITIGALSKSASAVIGGQEVRIFGEAMNLDIGAFSYLRLIITLLYALAVFIVGLLVLLISRKKYNIIAKRLDRNFRRKMILGLLTLIGASSLLLLLLVTLIAPLFYIILLIIASIPALMFIGRMILKSFSPKNSIYAEFTTGLVSVTLVKLLVTFLIPQSGILLSVIIVGVMNVFIYSLGLGIMVEQNYLKNNRGSSQRNKLNATVNIPEVDDGKAEVCDTQPESKGKEPEGSGKESKSDDV